jgi:hypothetical protein
MMFLGSIEKRAANRNAVVNVNSNLMVSAKNILLFLKKYQGGRTADTILEIKYLERDTIESGCCNKGCR